MGDNTTINRGRDGDIIATTDRAGVKFQQVLVDSFDGAGSDAFGRWRVSNPETIFESKLLGSDKQPLFWNELLESGSGISSSTPTENKPYIDITSTDSAAGVFTRQTFRRFQYQAGKSQLILMTAVLELASGTKTGCERRVGAFDDNNGLFFESDGGVIGVTVRSNDSGSPIDTTVVQSSWDDPMDGSGSSGFTIDWTKGQIFIFDYQWLSIGRVRFGVEIEGRIFYVHEINQANVSTIPWSSTPNLPLRYQMVTTSDSGVCSMRAICASVVSEGGRDPVGVAQSESTTQHVNANTSDTFYALIGLRLKTSQLGCTVLPERISIVAETNDMVEWRLFHNPSVTGTFTYVDKDNSCCQIVIGDTGNPSTNIVTSGNVLAAGFLETKGEVQSFLTRNSLRLGSAVNGTRDTLILAARGLASNADIQGSFNWIEFF